MSDQVSITRRVRLGFVRFWGYGAITLASLFILSGALTLLIQLFSPESFPELPPLITIFCMLVAALFIYIGWRVVKASPEELRPFLGK